MEKGYKVARVEQVSDPVPGKVVDREVVEVYTPATYVAGDGDAGEYIFSLSTGSALDVWHLARGNFVAWRYLTTTLTSSSALLEFLHRYRPQEVLLPVDMRDEDFWQTFVRQHPDIACSYIDEITDVDETLMQLLWVDRLDSFGRAVTEGRGYPMAQLLYYLHSTHKKHISLAALQYFEDSSRVRLDATTIKNLEIFLSSYHGDKEHTLYNVLNVTSTPLGSRLLKDRLLHPIADAARLAEQHMSIDYYVHHASERQELSTLLKHLGDIQKKYIRMMHAETPTPAMICEVWRPLFTLWDSQLLLTTLGRLGMSTTDIDRLQEILSWVESMIGRDSLPELWQLLIAWFDTELDALRQTAFHSDQALLSYHQELVQATWIQNIKIKFMQQLWYTIDVTPKDIDAFVACTQEGDDKFDFIRVQSRKWGNRYSSTYLSWLESRIIAAKERMQQQEQEYIFLVQQRMSELYTVYTTFCQFLADIDLAVHMADFCIRHKWTKPDMTEDRDSFSLEEVRHPVIEAYLPASEEFIPNDVSMRQGWLHIVTWPNMGGKSTYLRQNALCVLLAHAGLWVPARRACIPYVDGIFARVGSGDALAAQQSTFMTEMLEMANILHGATYRSFIILDELGRGTSTYDWLSLAKAVCVYMC